MEYPLLEAFVHFLSPFEEQTSKHGHSSIVISAQSLGQRRNSRFNLSKCRTVSATFRGKKATCGSMQPSSRCFSAKSLETAFILLEANKNFQMITLHKIGCYFDQICGVCMSKIIISALLVIIDF